MPDIARVSIEDGLASAGADPRSGLAYAVATLDAIRKIAVALDHVVTRSNDSIRRYGKIDKGDQAMNLVDIAEAERQSEILHVGLETAFAMIAAMKSRIGIEPPKPKAAPVVPPVVAHVTPAIPATS